MRLGSSLLSAIQNHRIFHIIRIWSKEIRQRCTAHKTFFLSRARQGGSPPRTQRKKNRAPRPDADVSSRGVEALRVADTNYAGVSARHNSAARHFEYITRGKWLPLVRLRDWVAGAAIISIFVRFRQVFPPPPNGFLIQILPPQWLRSRVFRRLMLI